MSALPGTDMVSREVSAILIEVFWPILKAHDELGLEREDSPWGGGASCHYDIGETFVVNGARGRVQFRIPAKVAVELVQRHLEREPEALWRVREEWMDEMRDDARYDGCDDPEPEDDGGGAWAEAYEAAAERNGP